VIFILVFSPFPASASRILDLDARVVIRVSARGLFASFSRGSAMYPTYSELALFLAVESILASYCSVSMPFILFISTYPSIRTTPMQLKLHYAWRWKTTRNEGYRKGYSELNREKRDSQ